MNIAVINGSPKGKNSITLQTVLYLEQQFPEHVFEYIDAGFRIHAFEKDISEVLPALEKADLILFSYPVYTFLAPSQLHRFIRLLKTSGVDLSGKYATQISTSKHFYDITAHQYIEENCIDLGMKVIRGLSADMEDLTKEKGQKQAEDFFSHAVWCMENDLYLHPAERPEQGSCMKADVPEEDVPKNDSRRIALVADLTGDDGKLQSMIERFCRKSPYPADLIDLQEFAFKGGCLGCFNCASDGKCIYKDGFDVLLRERIQQADAIVYAFTVCDHSMGTKFKTYDDRQFCNGHRTVTAGTPMGYLVNGPYHSEPNLKLLLEARSEVGGNFLAGVAGNEEDPDREIDEMILQLGYAVENGYAQPPNFYGVGGMKIFRDLIWQMRGLMKEDHRFYKSHGLYDFPQKKRGSAMLMYLVGAMMSNPKIKAKMGNKMNEGMLAPYKKVLDKKKGEKDA